VRNVVLHYQRDCKIRFIFLCAVRDVIVWCVRDIFLGNVMRRKIIFLRGNGVKLF